MNNKIDLRIVKTKQRLYETLVNLLMEKSFEEIKVSDICEKSLINRSTFYAHYSDKYELFDSYIKDLEKELRNNLNKNNQISNTKEYYLEELKILLNQINDKKNIYSSIIINNKNSIIMDMFYDTMKEDITKQLNNKKISKSIPSDIIVSFYLGAVFSVTTEWLRNNSTYSKEDIIANFEKLIPDDLYN